MKTFYRRINGMNLITMAPLQKEVGEYTVTHRCAKLIHFMMITMVTNELG